MPAKLQAPEYPDELRCLPALPEEDLIGRTLAFANRGDRSSFWLVWTGLRLPALHLAEMHDGNLKGFPGAFTEVKWGSLLGLKGDPPSPTDVMTFIDAERAEVQKALRLIVEKRSTLPAHRRKWKQHAADGLSLVLTYGPGGEPRYRYFTRAPLKLPVPPIARVLMHLAESGDLYRCAHCGMFFLRRNQEGPGRKATKYCSPEHMLQANEADAARRMREYRKRQAKLK